MRRLHERAPPCVEFFQLLGHAHSLLSISGAQQLIGQFAAGQPPRRVEARRQPKGDGRRIDAPFFQPCLFHQRSQPGPHCPVDLRQPALHQAAVFAEQRHHIGHSAQRHQVEQRLFHRGDLVGRQPTYAALCCCPQHRLRQPIGHADAGQFGRVRRAIRAARVDHRQRRRQLAPHRVMVGHDHIQPHLPGIGHLGHAADATVHRDQHLRGLCNPANGVQVQPVAFVHAVGDVGADPRPGHLQRAHQQRGRADAVHVEVAVDADRLAALDGVQDALHRGRHVAQPVGIVDGDILGGEKALRRGWRGQPAVVEHLRQQRVFGHGAQKGIRCSR
jgi:hypothetical protein